MARVLWCIGVLVLVALLPPVFSARSTNPRALLSVTATAVPGAPLALDTQQAQEVAVLVDFLRAYNAGHVARAVALFGPAGSWSDCDYRRGHAVGGRGTASLKRWLQERAADHDRLDLGHIDIGTLQEDALGALFTRRMSTTLRTLGHPHGIVPQGGAKVLFAYRPGAASPPTIATFANGPIGGSQEPCLRP